MRLTDKWWSAPTEANNGKTIIVTGRDDMEEAMACGKYKYRIDVSWDYNALPNGMPEEEESRLMEQVTDALLSAFKKDKVAIVTGIYTGDGRRDWIFYCMNLFIFSKVFNKALEQLPLVPFVIDASEDADWEEYRRMRDLTYIPDAD